MRIVSSLRPFAALAAAALLATPLRAQTPASQPAADSASPRLMAPAPTAAPAGAHPLSLEDALRRAVQESEQVGIARAGVSRAQGDLKRSRSEFFPQLSAFAGYTRTLKSQFSVLANDSSGTPTDTLTSSSCSRFAPDPSLPLDQRVTAVENSLQCVSGLNPFAGLTTLPFGQANQYSLGLQFSQTLWAGGRIRAQSRAAGAQLSSARIELTSQQAQLALDVVQSYYDAALSDRLVSIAEASLDQAERTLNDTRLARQVGNQPEFELLRATVTRDNQRPVVIQRRAQRDIAYLRLKAVLNLPLDQPLALTSTLGDTVEAAPAAVAVPTSYVQEGAADTNPDRRAAVRQAEQSVAAAEGQLGVANAGRWPSLVLSSNFQRFAYPSDAVPGWKDFVSDWTVGLSLRVPVFTGGRVSGERQVAQAGVEQARLRMRQTRELAAIDARNAQAQLEAAEATWAASQGTVEQAGRAYGIAEIRYREGISTQTELSDSRLLMQQAQANRAQAARDLQVARVRMALLRDLPLVGAVPAATATLQAVSPIPGTTATPNVPATGTNLPGGATAATAVGGVR